MTPRTVSPERTGWRDEALSRRHRQWGHDCPMVDVDFLVCEYDRGWVHAHVEYKREDADLSSADPNNPSNRALMNLCQRAKMAFFIVRYAIDLSWYEVRPMNWFARKEIPGQVTMDERTYVQFLYRLRHRDFAEVEPEILAQAGFQWKEIAW